MVSCDHQRTTQPHHIKDSLAYDIESIKIIPSNDILELKSYHITSPFSCQNIDGIIAYNYRLHSLDLIDLYNHKEISSIPLQREGPDGIPGRVAGIFPLSKDSIWVYDGIYMYLLNSAGRVNEKITLEDRESLIINTNYAMNTAKFSYNPKRHSLLYLTRKDDFIVEEYDIKKRKIIKTYPLSYSIINPKGSLLYADMDAPNVNFVDNKIIYNYPYESTIYLLDMDSGKQLLIDAPSCYTSTTGISIFRNLRSIVIDTLYDNKLCIDELVSLEKLEELCMSFYPITKYQYPTLNKLNRLKRLKIKGLDSNILSCLPNLETLTCFNLKDGAHLGIKAPNLRSIDIYRSPKILNLNFLLDLKELRSIGLDGLSNVEEMPDLSNLHSLTGMSLANMKRLQSFPLYHENLKNLLLQLPFDVLDNIIPENLPNLKHISVNLGSDKKNGMVLDRFKGICEVGIW